MPAPKRRPGNRGWAGAARVFAALTLSGGLLFAPPARAGPDQESGRALQLEVFLNGETRNLLASFTDLSERGLAATRKELREVGMKLPGDGADEDLIPLAGMPDVTYHYD